MDEEIDPLDRKLRIVDEFVNLMSPLVPKGKIAMEIIDLPTRKKEKDITEQLIEIAKNNKLHRKIKNAQCGIFISFNEDVNDLNGQYIQLKMGSLTQNDRVRRISIIFALIFVVIFLLRQS